MLRLLVLLQPVILSMAFPMMNNDHGLGSSQADTSPTDSAGASLGLRQPELEPRILANVDNATEHGQTTTATETTPLPIRFSGIKAVDFETNTVVDLPGEENCETAIFRARSLAEPSTANPCQWNWKCKTGSRQRFPRHYIEAELKDAVKKECLYDGDKPGCCKAVEMPDSAYKRVENPRQRELYGDYVLSMNERRVVAYQCKPRKGESCQ